MLIYEWNHMTRVIPLDGRPHLPSGIRLPTATLASAISTGEGVFHSDQLHVVERFALVDRDTINCEATISDRKVLKATARTS